MPRSANRTPKADPPTTRLVLTMAELNILQRNAPGPSGKIGGYGQGENWVIDNISDANVLALTDARVGRFVRYIVVGPAGYGPGGPQKRLRAALIPAFCRLFGVTAP